MLRWVNLKLKSWATLQVRCFCAFLKPCVYVFFGPPTAVPHCTCNSLSTQVFVPWGHFWIRKRGQKHLTGRILSLRGHLRVRSQMRCDRLIVMLRGFKSKTKVNNNRCTSPCVTAHQFANFTRSETSFTAPAELVLIGTKMLWRTVSQTQSENLRLKSLPW